MALSFGQLRVGDVIVWDAYGFVELVTEVRGACAVTVSLVEGDRSRWSMGAETFEALDFSGAEVFR